MEIYTATNDPPTLNIESKKQIGKHIQFGFIYLDFKSRQRQAICCVEITQQWVREYMK